MRRRSRGCLRRKDTMNVNMILPFSKNAYVGNFRHSPFVSNGSQWTPQQTPTASGVARALLPSALRRHPLVGALSHAPHSTGLKALIADLRPTGHLGAGAGAGAGAMPRVLTAADVAASRATSPVSVASSGGRSSPASFSSADHEYGGISNWATRMGASLDLREDHMDTWRASGPDDLGGM